MTTSEKTGTDWQPDGLFLIAAERRRQVEVKGYDAAHDDGHDREEIAAAAATYAAGEIVYGREQILQSALGDHVLQDLPDLGIAHWSDIPAKLDRFSRLRTLQVAAALIAGELDRVIGMAREAGESLPADVLVNPPVKPHRRHRPGDGAEAGQ